jgi:hypothetical protein
MNTHLTIISPFDYCRSFIDGGVLSSPAPRRAREQGRAAKGASSAVRDSFLLLFALTAA